MKLDVKDKQQYLKILFYLLMISPIIGVICSMMLFLLVPGYDGASLTQDFQQTLQKYQVLGYLLIISQLLVFFSVNRICVLLEQDQERQFNETIMKAKKSSGVGFIFGVLMLITFFLVVPIRLDLIANTYVYNAGNAKDQGLTDMDVIIAAVWVVLFGTFFMLGILFTNFYVGRLISYYANQKKMATQEKKWQVYEVFGIIWSLQFLLSYFIPALIYIIVNGILTGMFALIMVSLSKENLTEISFTSELAKKIKENDLKIKNQTIMKKCIQLTMIFSLILIGTLWFGATFLYARNKAWYDWGFYFVLGLVILLIPLLALCHSDGYLGQQLLKTCFLIISIIALFYLILSLFSYTDILVNYVLALIFHGRVNYIELATGFLFKPGQYMLLFLVFLTNMVCLLALKKGLLPIKSNKGKKSIKQYINIKKWATAPRIYAFLFLGIFVFSIISYEGIGANVVLENDRNFRPRISFWEWDGEWDDHEDATLDKLSNYSMNLYGGYGRSEQYKSQMEKYYDRGIKVRVSGDNYAWIDWIEDQREKGWDKCPIDGFIEDIEDGGSLNGYDRYQNEQERAEYEELIDYAHKHGFSQHFTAMHTTINDQRDGDLDMSIFHQIHSVPPLDWDSWNWMIYRAEAATHYEEESPYFTYQWVKEMKDTFNDIYGTKYDHKLSVSLGVTSKDYEIYAREGGLEQFLWDLRICDALEISEVIIFILNPLDSDCFLGIYGLKGLDRIYNQINDWDTLVLPYSRSATFYGNIKYLENPTGSVFGNYWMDLFLDNGLIFLAIAWSIIQMTSYATIIQKYLSRSSETK